MKRGQTRLDERCRPSYHLTAAGSCLPWREIRGCELAGYPGRCRERRRVALPLVSLTAVGQGLKIRPSEREAATEPAGPARDQGDGVTLPIMLSLAVSSRLVADLGSMVFWLLMNNKVVGLVSGAAACFLIWKTDGRFQGRRLSRSGPSST